MAQGIYKIINIITNDFYIGSSVNIERRWKTHRNELMRGIHHNAKLLNAYHKYGKYSFEYSIVQIIKDVNSLITIEQLYLDEQKPTYNICTTAGNSLNRKHSEAAKQKMSAIKLGVRRNKEFCEIMRNCRLGKKLSEESKQKVSRANLGRVTSEKTKQKLSKASFRRYELIREAKATT